MLALGISFPSTFPFFMLAGAAPFTTYRPCVRTSTTSFGARVLSVSTKFAASVFKRVAPSVGVEKRMLFGMPDPQVIVYTPSTPTVPSSYTVYAPTVLPTGLYRTLMVNQLSDYFASELTATPIEFAFFYTPCPAAAASSEDYRFSFGVAFACFHPLVTASYSSGPVWSAVEVSSSAFSGRGFPSASMVIP